MKTTLPLALFHWHYTGYSLTCGWYFYHTQYYQFFLFFFIAFVLFVFTQTETRDPLYSYVHECLYVCALTIYLNIYWIFINITASNWVGFYDIFIYLLLKSVFLIVLESVGKHWVYMWICNYLLGRWLFFWWFVLLLYRRCHTLHLACYGLN